MFRNSTNSASFDFVMIATLVLFLSLAKFAAAQSNTRLGTDALVSNTTGNSNTALGFGAL